LSESGRTDSTPLLNLLIEEAGQLRGFLVLLEKEQQALVDGDVDRLLPLAAEKNDAFGRLARLGEARAQQLAEAGFGADRPGMEAWLARQPEARPAWEALLALASRASDLNRSNGKLIASRLAHNQQALATLLAAANQAALYGPDGQARPVGGGRSLGTV
jgi:flagella synthesis protein FlgN